MKKRMIIDIDDVISDGGFLHLINTFLGSTYQQEDSPTFYLQDLIPPERRKEFFIWFQTQNMYDYVVLKDDCYEVLERIFSSDKLQPCVCSSLHVPELPRESSFLASQKYDFLLKTFPFIKVTDIIIGCNKEMIKADIRLDDSLSNLHSDAKERYLFTAYHNRMISEEELAKTGIVRVNSWKELEKLLDI